MPKIVTPLFNIGDEVYVLLHRSFNGINNLVKGTVIKNYPDTVVWPRSTITYVIKTELPVLGHPSNKHTQSSLEGGYLSIDDCEIKCSRDRVVPYTKASQVLYGTEKSEI